ncbi:MAG TPA: FAD-dependent oxidoreductase, partial [Thermoanaerobaculia bacterium]|nr:FAD-dependent oxidoreductase [Thermoanaerobaculia bacterium]
MAQRSSGRSGTAGSVSAPVSRRDLLRGLSAASLLAAAGSGRAVARALSPSRSRPSVVVVGAGAFGAFSALSLLRGGAKVTLVDSWGPGNSRSSSGGETRVIRGVYGPDRVYVEMVARAFDLWRENERRWNRKLYHPTGAIWLVTGPDDYIRSAMPLLAERGFPFEELSTGQARRRWPQIDYEGVRWVFREERAGYLLARQACAAAVAGFVSEGGEYRETAVEAGAIRGGGLTSVRLSDGSTLTADSYVFACGPWLPKVFPDVLAGAIEPTRQEEFFFGTPSGDGRFSEETMPVWVDFGPRLFYGIPGNERRGFKVADDSRGAPFDPTGGDRVASAEGLRAAREFLGRRFPALKNAPVTESRVCQYENTTDHRFLLDRHPGAANVWIAGGGSGHGFKMGPAVGERIANLV